MNGRQNKSDLEYRSLMFAPSPAPSVWGSKLPFNTICGEYSSPAGGWVHAVGFSPSGDVLAFASKPCFPLLIDRSFSSYI